jgi:hypothetical protein
MPHLRDLPELVRDSELRVTIHDNITIHKEPLECRDSFLPQHWETKRTIGRGGDGTVFLQQKIKGPGATDEIAVKQISLNAKLTSEDHDSKRYVRELEALAKFAQGRVGQTRTLSMKATDAPRSTHIGLSDLMAGTRKRAGSIFAWSTASTWT